MPSRSGDSPARAASPTPLLRPFLTYVAFGLLQLNGMRVALLIMFRSSLGSPDEWPRLFLTGLRFDLLLMSYLMVPAWLVVCLAPPAWDRATKFGLRVYLTTALAVMALLECASWPSLREYGSRPEALFLEYLGHPHEIAGMLAGGFLLESVSALLLVTFVTVTAWRRIGSANQQAWPNGFTKLMLLPVGAIVLFLGARSSVQHRAANLSSAVFSQNHFHNELALNSTYTLLYAGYRRKHEAEPSYGTLDPAHTLAIIRAESGLEPADNLGLEAIPTLHRQHPLSPREGPPPNIVVILLESFGAEYTGRLGGTALTPNFDRLAREGIAFDQLFSTGTRTSRGIEAVLAGFYPTPARSVLKLGLSQRDFFTAPELFRRAGYETHFIYGGAANFDEMKSFLVGNGVEHVWDQSVLQKPAHAVGVWGIHDEDMFREADAIFRQQKDAPFFAFVLSTSNHTPFDYPAGKVAPDLAFPLASAENAIKYTDYALGKFFEDARRAPYYANTLFLVVADHGTRVAGDQLIPVYKFHIPAFILGPTELVHPEAIRTLASQVDLMPTLLALTGRKWDHPMLGRNLVGLSPAERADANGGRALLQYETHFGFWEGRDMVILRPGLPAAQFTVAVTGEPGAAGYRLSPAPVEPQLLESALAHSFAPSWLYRERRYHLPASEGSPTVMAKATARP